MVAMLAANQLADAPIIRMEAFEQSVDIIDRLRAGESLFVDFGDCRRAIDFINGAICAIDGDSRRFSNSVYFYVGRMA